jgi:hypothetical protein
VTEEDNRYFDTRLEALEDALLVAEIGATIIVCTSSVPKCPGQGAAYCELCARIPVVHGLTLDRIVAVLDARKR